MFKYPITFPTHARNVLQMVIGSETVLSNTDITHMNVVLTKVVFCFQLIKKCFSTSTLVQHNYFNYGNLSNLFPRDAAGIQILSTFLRLSVQRKIYAWKCISPKGLRKIQNDFPTLMSAAGMRSTLLPPKYLD